MAKNVGLGPNWVPATITKVLGQVTYEVKRDNGQVWKRHVELFKKFTKSNCMRDSTEEQELPWVPAAGEIHTQRTFLSQMKLNLVRLYRMSLFQVRTHHRLDMN